MNIFVIVAVALISVIAVVILRQLGGNLQNVLIVAVCIAIFVTVIDQLYDVVMSLYNVSILAGVDKQSVICVVKIAGIAYVAEFTNSICADADCKTIGERVLFASKIAIVVTAMPILMQLLDVAVELLK